MFFLTLLIIILTTPCQSILARIDIVDFEYSVARHTTPKSCSSEMYALSKRLYEKHAHALLTPKAEPIIPKIIHQIWLGSPVPEHLKALMKSWKALHPDWEYILWTDKMVENFPLKNRAIYNAAKNYGQRSDIVRYEILEKFGGIYVDVDFRCIKPFDDLHHTFDFFAGMIADSYAANGLIAATPGHPLLKIMIESINHVSARDNFQNIIDITGPGLLERIFLENAEKVPGKNILMPCTYFYPSPNTVRHLPYKAQDSFIKPESFAIHYWGCSWQKPAAFVK